MALTATTQSANPTLRVRVTSGVQLDSDQITVHIALTAVRGMRGSGRDVGSG